MKQTASTGPQSASFRRAVRSRADCTAWNRPRHPMRGTTRPYRGYEHVYLVLYGGRAADPTHDADGSSSFAISTARKKPAMTILTADVERPFGYGRIIRTVGKRPGGSCDRRAEGVDESPGKDRGDQLRLLCLRREDPLPLHRSTEHRGMPTASTTSPTWLPFSAKRNSG